MRIPAGEKFWGALGYLPLVCLVVAWKVRRDSMFVQFHARQGAVLFVLWAAVAFVLVIALAATGGSLIAFALLFLATGFYGVMVLLTILLKVLPGERYRMPVVADIALKMGL